ncbi:DUF6188 family protein [Mycobacterium sp. NPDC048908]|uniref:DUF6188 family protein n=1 Tax=Mycobacterium sp. NPDC048908 TaxID=3364292 RepID=UPI0037237906
MDLGLRGKRLLSVSVEFAARMQVSDTYFITIESPFTLHVGGNAVALSPEEHPDNVLQALRQLIGYTIDEATADEAGALHVVLGGGVRITVESDPAYEAWNVSSSDGALVVSAPGGRLVSWKPQPNANRSAESSPDQ